VSLKKPYDLAVAYRICPFVSRAKPPVFADSKLQLSALCLRSFKEGLGNLKVKLWVLLDNCPPEYEALFTALWPAEDLVLLRFPGLGNMATLMKQIDILMTQEDADFVYMGEDDYVYLPGCFPRMLDLLKHHPDVDFCTAYDHPDYYNFAFHLHKTRIKVEGGQVWKTQNGTTGTVLARTPIIRETGAVLKSIARKTNTDAGIWLSLTKEHVFNPVTLLTQPFISKFRGWSLVCAWLYNWRQLLFGRRYTVWVSVPALATHMVGSLLAPHVDWEKRFELLGRNLPAAAKTGP
jgi:hypothetical protein